MNKKYYMQIEFDSENDLEALKIAYDIACTHKVYVKLKGRNGYGVGSVGPNGRIKPSNTKTNEPTA